MSLDVVGGSWTDMFTQHSRKRRGEEGQEERKDMSLKVGPDEAG